MELPVYCSWARNYMLYRIELYLSKESFYGLSYKLEIKEVSRSTLDRQTNTHSIYNYPLCVILRTLSITDITNHVRWSSYMF